MAPEWRLRPLGEVTENFDALRVPVKEPDRRPGPYPYYGASGVVDYVDKYIFDGLHLLVAEDGENLRTRKLPIAFFADGKFWVNNHVHIIRGNDRADTRFLMYAITVADMGSYLTGSTMPKLTQGNLNRIPVVCPPVEVQKEIAGILGALDDKIEMNRRMNETLAAMAQALFKDWFIDFGPTYAKIERRQPYLASEIWALFPDRLDDNLTPVGWYEERFLDHARLISGGTPKTEVAEYWGGSIAWASAKDVSQCSDPFLIRTERLITGRGLEESSTRMIPKLATVVVARGATTGRFCMFGEEMAMNQTCYALDSTQHRPFWLNCAFSNVVDVLVHAAHGSVFNTITTITIESARVIVAPNPLMMRFEETVSPLFNKILVNIKESHTLCALRDLLLPKLISGEIRVKEAEQIMAEVA